MIIQVYNFVAIGKIKIIAKKIVSKYLLIVMLKNILFFAWE